MDGSGVSIGELVGRASTSYEAAGGRRRFTVELRPGETTIVSWKKLHKDTTNNNKSNVNGVGSGSTMSVGAAASVQPPVPHPSLEARLAPVGFSFEFDPNSQLFGCVKFRLFLFWHLSFELIYLNA